MPQKMWSTKGRRCRWITPRSKSMTQNLKCLWQSPNLQRTMRLSNTSTKRFHSPCRRRLWISPLSPPILMNNIHGKYDYRTTISTCDQRLRNPNHKETNNEETVHRTPTWGGQLHKHLDDSISNQPVNQMQWTLITCPPMIKPIWWRKASVSNAESLDTEQEIRSFIWNSNEAATLRCNDHHRRWKERSSTHMSGRS